MIVLALLALFVPVVRTTSFSLSSPIKEVFPLFEPLGEKRWAKGWDPKPVWPAGLKAVPNAVFTTTHPDGTKATWVIVVYQPPHEISYVRFVAEHHTATVTVKCEVEDAKDTKVDVNYRFLALSPEGEEYVESQTEEQFEKTMASWKKHLLKALAKHG